MAHTAKTKTGLTWQRSLPYILLVGGLIGLCASFALTYDKIHVLENPAYQPGCNINPVLSCGSVMKTQQASLLGVPNTVFGLMAFSMLIMLSLILLSGAVLQRWLWRAAQAAASAGVLFMHYLFFEAVFRIHAICPWCFAVWMVTIIIFFSVTVYNLREGNLGSSRIGNFVSRYSNDIIVLWYIGIFLTLLTKFWYYWKTLL